MAASKRASVREQDMTLRDIAATIGVPAKVSDRSMQRQIGDAVRLVEDFPATVEARERNEITRQHVRVLTDIAADLPAEVLGEFEAEALERCRRDTTGRVKAGLEILAQRMHPRSLVERHRDAREGRDVRTSALPDGMSCLTLIAPTPVIAGIDDRFNQMATVVIDTRNAAKAEARARGVDGGGDDANVLLTDERTRAQIRADIAADILLSGSPFADPTIDGDGPGTLGTIRAKIQVIVPALNLLDIEARTGHAAGAADLVGYSPIDPATARELAGNTGRWWERLVTHPITGQVLHTDGYQRTAAIDRHLRARDQHCRFPGCRIPAIRCEIDHTHDHALGGKTTVSNLSHLCQRHHSMKQFTSWKVKQLHDGILEWTS
ncbi:DUF222 domain-containing protein, partial [Microbacterium sediminicola]|uniref:HNH endonuclease signature motif containing protein n=1 Tax=Microbacterium sediminicola TaxID=415210 RepID=UPI003CD05767